MMNDRFDELSRKPDAQFLSAGASGSGLTPTVETFSLGAGVQDGKIEAGLSALAIEAKRVERARLRRRASSIARRSGRWPATTARTPSATRPRAARYAQEYVNHFLEGEPSPGIAYEHQLAQAVDPGDHAADVNAAAKSLLSRTRAA